MTSIFAQRRQKLLAMKAFRDGRTHTAPAGTACPGCGQTVGAGALAQTQYVCPHCGYHLPLGGYIRLTTILDPGSFRELNARLTSADPLHFPGYQAKLEAARKKTGLNEAVVTAMGTVDGRKCVAGVLDGRFFLGSMSAAVGEKITRAIEYATKYKLPLILFSASGGARMQEGILSHGQLCEPWRCDFGGAGGADRLCRSPGYRADHRPEIAGGLPAFGVSAGAWLCGCGGAQG